MKRLLASAGTALLLLPSLASAQTVDAAACAAHVEKDLTQIHDTYRSVLFGSREISGGKFAVLTGGFTDAARRGIFETQRRLTSELVTPLVESYRVYRCRSLEVCQLLAASLNENGGQIDLRPLGCANVTATRYAECFLGADTETADVQSTATDLAGQCQILVDQTLRAEQSVLKLAVGYDAGYRSLLQMAGMMDWMLEGFPTAALKAISEMVNMLGKLHQIPCFIGQCDNPRSDYLTAP